MRSYRGDSSVAVGPTAANTISIARLWLTYRTGAVGMCPPQTLIVQDSGGTQSWTITVIGNTVGRKTAATAMVLDRSLSMSGDRGDGLSKHLSLQQAAGIFVDVMLEGDGVGIVRFNENAQPLQSILQLGDGGPWTTAPTRGNHRGLRTRSQRPDFHRRRHLRRATAAQHCAHSRRRCPGGADRRHRKSPAFIADVAGDQRVHLRGRSGAAAEHQCGGPADDLRKQRRLSAYPGAIDTENQFLLQKHFRGLAGISNAQVVLDHKDN
jgi:hypothetical protein